MTDRITITQRQAMFKATCELLRVLSRSIYREDDSFNLTKQLYRRVVTAAMTCPGFTPLMKDDVAYMFDMDVQRQLSYGQPLHANSWRHQYGLVPKPGIPLDVVEVSPQPRISGFSD